MSKIRVRIVVEATGMGLAESAAKFPVSFTWDQEYTTTGDNPRFYGSQLQNAVDRAANQAIKNLAPFCQDGGIQR